MVRGIWNGVVVGASDVTVIVEAKTGTRLATPPGDGRTA
jgi:hypothetical protein